MTEGEVVERLVEFTNILLTGVSVYFAVISAYVAAIYYFLHQAGFFGRAAAFGFISFILAILLGVLKGAQGLHDGLIARLREIDAAGGLTAAGRAALANADGAAMVASLSADQAIVAGLWIGAGLTYLGMVYLAFFHNWLDY